MCFCIAERGIPGFAIRLGTDICGDWQQIPRPVLTAAIWLMAFQVLAIFYVACCKELRPIAQVSALEGLFGRIVAGNRHAPGSLSSLFVEVCGSKHRQQFVVQCRF